VKYPFVSLLPGVITDTIFEFMATYVILTLLLILTWTIPALAQAQPPDPSTGESFTASDRWSHYLHRTFGPTRLGVLAAETAIDHGFREPRCWDDSAGSYIQRYARVFDRRLIRNTTELATGLLTGEDLRYSKSRSHSFQGRVWHAVRASVVARMPDGTERPAYSRFFASATTELTTAHWVGQPIRTGWLFRSVGWSALDQAQTNLLDEFGPDIRRIAFSLWRTTRNRTGLRHQP
jgi:hypothetical protein